ncbi:MAG: tetratricopeptide repeat protein [Promethearchaeota archaeon]
MSHPELNQLTRAEQLADAGKLDMALEILNDKREFEGLSSQQKGYFQFLRGLILFYQTKTEELITFGEELFREGQHYSNKLQSFDGLFFNAMGLNLAYRFDEALEKIEKAEKLIKNISSISQKDLKLGKARLSVAKAYVGLHGGKVDLVEKSLVWILNSQEKFDNSFEIVWANLIMASYLVRVKNKFDLSKEHIKKALSLAKEIKFNHVWIALCQLYFGVYYLSIGEMDKSLKYYKKGLELFKKINCTLNVAILLNNMGNLFGEMGEYDLAVEHLEESLNLYEQNPHRLFNMELPIESLITLAVEHGDYERAQKYFHRFEVIYDQKRNDKIEFLYKFDKALILKTSSRIRDKAKAQEILKELIETDTIHFDLIIKAHIHLCDILLTEYRIENNIEVFNELNYYISKLLDIAQNRHSYLIFCETFILRAKVALINFNMKTARRYLTQAQKIAEKFGIKRLATKISYEHDELLKKLKMWEKLKESEAPLSERVKLASLNEQMEIMTKKRIVEVPKLSDEDPILLLILSEGGIPIFSKMFKEKMFIEEDLISSFLAAFNSFSAELFSEGLDRASFGEFTVLIKPILTFLVCYLFKGQSFSAQKRIKNYIEKLGKNKELLEKFNDYYNTNQVVTLEDAPALNSLIKETFEKKNFV